MIKARIATLQNIYVCFKTVGIHWIVQSLHDYQPFMGFDDFGLFLYVPILAHITGLDVIKAASVFIIGLGLAAYIITFLSWFMLSQSYGAFLITTPLLFWLLKFLQQANDVYIASFFAISCIPFSLVLLKKNKKNIVLLGAVFIGIFLSMSDLIRSYAGLASFCFFIIVLWGSKNFSIRYKFLILSMLLFGYGIPQVHFYYQQNKTEHFLIHNSSSIQKISPQKGFWHNIYIGFGFIRNPYDIEYSDTSGRLAAEKVDPESVYGTLHYETIIRKLIIHLLQQDRHFFFTALFAKLGVVFFYFIWCFGWLGLLCSYFYPKPWYEEVAFVIALAISALPGILTVPVAAYLTGFSSCTIIYTCYSLIVAWNNGMVVSFKRRSFL